MKILLAVDGSENALRAAKQALHLSKLNPEVEVTALYVAPSYYDLFPASGVHGWIQQKEVNQEIEARAEKVFDTVRDLFAAEGQAISTVVEQGDTGVVICRVATEGKFDLVVMGSRGYGAIKGIILGSVSHKVLYLCPCPVMTVK